MKTDEIPNHVYMYRAKDTGRLFLLDNDKSHYEHAIRYNVENLCSIGGLVSRAKEIKLNVPEQDLMIVLCWLMSDYPNGIRIVPTTEAPEATDAPDDSMYELVREQK